MPENDLPPPDTDAAPPPPKSALRPGESKADYIRRVGPGLRPFQVVQRARMDGIPLTVNYVARIRSLDKKAAATPAAKPSAPSPPKLTAPKLKPSKPGRKPRSEKTGTARAAHIDGEFRTAATRLILEHGIARASEILDDIVARLRAAAES